MFKCCLVLNAPFIFWVGSGPLQLGVVLVLNRFFLMSQWSNNEKFTPLTVKKWIFKNIQKSLFSNGKMSYQPKYHIPRWKIVTGSLKTKNYQCYIREKSKNVHRKHKNENFGNNDKMRFFLMDQGLLNLKNRFLGQKMWPVWSQGNFRNVLPVFILFLLIWQVTVMYQKNEFTGSR